MSDDLVVHDGDAIARNVPQLATFQDQVGDLGQKLSGALAQYNFADGATDEMSLQAQVVFQQLMTLFGQIYGALAQAVGLQGDRLNVVRQIGDQTEGAATDSASGWDGSGDRKG